MWPASARGRTPGLETFIDEKKNILTFSRCKLETIKIEGEVTNSMKLLFEEKNEPKRWVQSWGWEKKGKIKLILELAENFSVSHYKKTTQKK